MTARQQWGIVGAIVAVLIGGALTATHYLGSELFPVSVGSKAPPFAGKVVQSSGYAGPDAASGPIRTIDNYRGQVVLLNVWATWCGPCAQEMPAIEKLHRALGPRGLHVVAVSVDEVGPTYDAAIRAFVKVHGLTFEVLHDTSFAIEKAYQTTGYPETFVIARDGTIRKKMMGAADWNSPANHALIEQLLAEPAPGA